MRALITGIGGFVGGHLANLLRQEGFDVCGIDRRPVSAGVAASTIATELGDICDPSFTNRVVRDFQPTHAFHFAWEFDQNRPGGADAANRNVLGVSVLLKAIGMSAREARVVIASSSAVYGAPERQPIDEEAPLKPTTSYGASKVAIEAAAASFRSAHGLNIVVTRTFNVLGPGMPRRLFAGSLAEQIAAAEHDGSRTIEVGRLDSSRDYIDVRDAARAYLALASQPTHEHSVFNVCSGVSRSSQELADQMLAQAKVSVKLVHHDSRMQTGDVDYQQGSAARLQRTTGWTPTIAFSTSVCDTLARARTRAG
jgi:GDP-4-dehydro-6-deoxy-D-mannose reductase